MHGSFKRFGERFPDSIATCSTVRCWSAIAQQIRKCLFSIRRLTNATVYRIVMQFNAERMNGTIRRVDNLIDLRCMIIAPLIEPPPASVQEAEHRAALALAISPLAPRQFVHCGHATNHGYTIRMFR